MKSKISLVLTLFLIPSFLLGAFLPHFSSAQASEEQRIEVDFFYSKTCPHCKANNEFLDKVQQKYPQIIINRYLVDKPQNVILWKEFCQKYDAERYLGLVPMTFIGDEFILGFDDKEGKGREIEQAILKQIDLLKNQQRPEEAQRKQPDKGNDLVKLPLLGKIKSENYSLPFLAVILGFFDGFNVCSLGALVLILSLVLVFRSRKRVLLFGSIYLVVTGAIYGILIFLWYQLFRFIGPYVRSLEILTGVLTLIGAGFFLRQFLRYRKYGPLCENQGKGMTFKVTQRFQDSFQRSNTLLLLVGSVLLFAALITIIEFPCSAVLPVVFASTLAQAKVHGFFYLVYLGIFLFFYLLDEIAVFLVAVFTMRLWITSGKFVTWMTLVASILLFLLSFYYFFGISKG